VADAGRLFRREPDGTYRDVTELSGLGDPGYGMGAAVGDVDNDGDLDLYLTNYGPDAFYRNNGDGTFTDATRESGLGNPAWGASAGFFDYDTDGWLDLYVTNYVRYDPRVISGRDEAGRPEYPGPETLPGVPDLLYRNDGGRRFIDVSVQSGIGARIGKGLGVVFTDLDEDGRVDVYVAHDRVANAAWIQQADGTFVDRALEMGLAFDEFGKAEAGMGIASGDVDGDGDLDLLVTNFAHETHTLYRNVRPGWWEDSTSQAGLSVPTVNHTGFGTVFFDLDHDGDLDLALLNGRVLRGPVLPGAALGPHWNPYAEPAQLFENDGTGRFREISTLGGDFAARPEIGRGLMIGDIDGDGDLDLLATYGNGTVRLFRNDSRKTGHWMKVRARDPALRRDAIGARLWLRAGGRVLIREITHTSSYLMSSEAEAHFGLGAANTADEIRVRWPDGRIEMFGPLLVDRNVNLVRGSGRER
jgi:hypothetical protein